MPVFSTLISAASLSGNPSGRRTSAICSLSTTCGMIAGMEIGERKKDFAGLRVLSLESRRGPEMAKLIASYGGEAVVAPSMREVPLETNTEALAFGRKLFAGGFDLVIFLTGVGTRALARVVETIYPLEQYSGRASQDCDRGPRAETRRCAQGMECPDRPDRARTEYLARTFARPG